MNEITTIKNEVKYRQWSEMIKSRCASGMTVVAWCAENGIKPKTYYYRLKCLPKATVEVMESQDIVPLSSVPQAVESIERIEIVCGNLKIFVPDNFKSDTLKRIVDTVLC